VDRTKVIKRLRARLGPIEPTPLEEELISIVAELLARVEELEEQVRARRRVGRTGVRWVSFDAWRTVP
jgi:hypothetical protein